jgi:hypothetical protein
MEHIGAASAPHLSALASLGIFDAEQLLGIVAAMGGTKEIAAATGLSDAEVAAMAQKATAALPSAVAAMSSVPQHIRYSLGALPLNAKIRAESESHLRQFPDRLMAAAPLALPPSVNHIPGLNAVQNQGARGTCVGFGSTAMHEYMRFVPQHAKIKLSEEFMYFQCKKLDGHPNDCGTWLLYAVKVLSALGEPLWSMLPYNPNAPCNHANAITAQILVNASLYKTQANYFSNARDVNAFKTALSGHNACAAFCIPVFNSWYQSPTVARTGQITMPLPGETSVGGHCMCFVGYQDSAAYPGGGYFILRNSWGTAWASQNPYGAGYGTIPYAYIATQGVEGASF